MKLSSALLVLFILCVRALSQEKLDPSQRYLLLGDVTKQSTQQQVSQAAAAGFRIMKDVVSRDFLVMEKAAAPDGVYSYMFLKIGIGSAGMSKLRNRLSGAGARGYRLLPPLIHHEVWTSWDHEELFLILEKSPVPERYQYWVQRSKPPPVFWPPSPWPKHRKQEPAGPPAGYQEVAVTNDYPWGNVRILERHGEADTQIASRPPAQQSEVPNTSAANGNVSELPRTTAREHLEVKGKDIAEFEAALNQAGARGFRLSRTVARGKVEMEKEAASEQRYMYQLVDARDHANTSTTMIRTANRGYKPVGIRWLGGFWSWSGDPVIVMEMIAPADARTAGP